MSATKKDIFGRMIDFANDTDNSYYVCHKQYFPLPLRISRCRGLSSQEKLVLMEMLYCFGDNDVAFPSLEYLAFQLDVDDKTISKNISKLIEKKFFNVYKKPNKVNRYYINMLETNPYITLSELTFWYEKTVQTREIPKQDLLPLIRKEIRRVTESKTYTDFLHRLLPIVVGMENSWYNYLENPELPLAKLDYDRWRRQEKEILDEYLDHLNQVLKDKLGSNIRSVQPLGTP